jgi:hypothetical protein
LIDSSELSSEQYHGAKNSFSSSQLKTIIQDPEVFYKKYITKEIAREENSAFDVGTYFHTSLLEPEKIESECAVYTGLARRGKDWEDFKERNKGKAIITSSEKITADRMIKSVQDSPISMSLLNNSRSEVSAFAEFFVLGNDIFAFNSNGCHCLTALGWVGTSLDYEEEDIKDFGTKLVIKVRADALGIGNGTISDLKSTTGNVKNAFEMASKVTSYEYDLSAALYLDVFTLASGEVYDTFVWIFSSKDKDCPGAMSWKASEKNILVGRAKVRRAIKLLAKYVSNGWVFEDQLGTLEPPSFALDWLVSQE